MEGVRKLGGNVKQVRSSESGKLRKWEAIKIEIRKLGYVGIGMQEVRRCKKYKAVKFRKWKASTYRNKEARIVRRCHKCWKWEAVE